jgi:AbrB family looped-hinge helix DNA binding protein
MSLVRVKNKFQVVIPQSIRDHIGVEVGDILEATAEKGRIVLKPKTIIVVDRDEYTPAERRRIDAQLATSLAEHTQSRSHGPFETHEEMTAFLHDQVRKSQARKKRPAAKRRKQ